MTTEGKKGLYRHFDPDENSVIEKVEKPWFKLKVSVKKSRFDQKILLIYQRSTSKRSQQ